MRVHKKAQFNICGPILLFAKSERSHSLLLTGNTVHPIYLTTNVLSMTGRQALALCLKAYGSTHFELLLLYQRYPLLHVRCTLLLGSEINFLFSLF